MAVHDMVRRAERFGGDTTALAAKDHCLQQALHAALRGDASAAARHLHEALRPNHRFVTDRQLEPDLASEQ